MRRIAMLASSILTFLALFTACTQAPPQAPTSRTAVIGPAGGTLTSADGRARVDIPAGALLHDTEFAVTPTRAQPPARYGDAISLGYTFTPSMSFMAPVRVTTRIEPQTLPANLEANLVIQNGATGTWSELDAVAVNLNEGVIAGSTMHFSTVVPVARDGRASLLGDPPFILPVPTSQFRLTQGFEVLDESVRHHSALDIGAARGTPVYAVYDGWIALAQRNHPAARDLGNTIVLGHELPGGRTVYSLYAHLETDNTFETIYNRAANSANCQRGTDGGASGSNTGQIKCARNALPVTQGTRIASVGNSAWSTIPVHLHFTIQTFPTLTAYDSTGTEHNPRVYTPGYPTDFGYLDPSHFWQPTRVDVPNPIGNLTGHTALRVIEGSNNLRAGPGTKHATITSISGGATLYKIATADTNDATCPTWYQVTRHEDFTNVDGPPSESDTDSKYADHYFRDQHGSTGTKGKGLYRTAWICADLVETAGTTPPQPPTTPTPTPTPPPSNTAPRIALLNHDGNAHTGDHVTFTWRTTDADGDHIRCDIDYGDGHYDDLNNCNGNQQITHRYTTAGTYTVRVTANDGRGGKDTASTTIRITQTTTPPPPPTTGPVITRIEPANPIATLEPQTVIIHGHGFVNGAGVRLWEASSNTAWGMDGKAHFIDENRIQLTGVKFGTPAGKWTVTVRNHPGTSQQTDSDAHPFWTIP